MLPTESPLKAASTASPEDTESLKGPLHPF